MLFFFKPKTAYELRISDWSSDVCSSDLSSVTEFGRAGLSDGINPTPINLLHWHQTRKRRLWAHDPQVPFLRSPTCQAYVAPSFIPASDSHSQDGTSSSYCASRRKPPGHFLQPSHYTVNARLI